MSGGRSPGQLWWRFWRVADAGERSAHAVQTHEPGGKVLRLAILIDADNANHRVIEPLLGVIGAHGRACIRRVYGDWSGTEHRRWQPLLSRHAITVVHQPRHAGRSNATDIALTVDAMDLLHARAVEGICLVTSDADFTRLACRVRESGLLVFGCGNRYTPRMLVSACDRFYVYDELLEADEALPDATEPQPANEQWDRGTGVFDLSSWLLRVYETLRAKRGEVVSLAEFGQAIHDCDPSFDPRQFGHRRLSTLLQSSGLFRLRTAPRRGGGTVTQLERVGESYRPDASR